MTEKTMARVQSANEYTFAVELHATKDEVRQIIEKTFGVKVAGVRTQISRGKEKRFGKARQSVKMSDRKYAVVKLKGKDKIELFDIQEQK